MTAEEISELRLENATTEIIRELLRITSEEPNDLIRVCARVWLQDHAIKLLKRHYADTEHTNTSDA